MTKIYITLAIGAVLFTVIGFMWLWKRRWGRWLMGTVLWGFAIAFAAAFGVSSKESAARRQISADEAVEQLAYQRGILAQLVDGRSPPTDCKYKGSSSYHCYCVSAAEATANTTTNAKRKPDGAGLACLDAAGLESEIKSHEPYVAGYVSNAAGARRNAWISFGAIGVLVLIMGVAIALSRRRAAPPRRHAGGLAST